MKMNDNKSEDLSFMETATPFYRKNSYVREEFLVSE